ncbi:hypothetical protein SCOCK_140205 [Actinacidiphila cocklensis]|uniref:Uncharacterized protein n=1 Tax=Actinacidiphila cocklensis TaxID=887465 RepID=A0A9W4GQX0_9ACTN|nr:hypothetical protein SCOCK_140205 [Actinacidiphila cocklensis]
MRTNPAEEKVRARQGAATLEEAVPTGTARSMRISPFPSGAGPRPPPGLDGLPRARRVTHTCSGNEEST